VASMCPDAHAPTSGAGTRSRVQRRPQKGAGIADRGAREDLFVGRKPELDELSAGLEDARGDRGRLFLLSGEPGIGKSRLIREFAARARENGARVLWGRCWEAGGAPPYWPWVQLIRAYVRGQESDATRNEIGPAAIDLVQILPEIKELFPELPPPPTVDPDSARFQLFDSTVSFLLNAADGGPLVLVLEDLHAADTPSLLLLRFLADQIADASLLVVGTYRDVELTPEHPLVSTASELSREPSTRRIHLKGLDEDDVATFVGAALRAAPPAQLISALRRETKGNPLFLGEAVRLLAAEGELGKSLDPAALRVAVPKSVRAVIGRRIGHLDDVSRRALSLASVLGTEFTTEALRRLGGMDPGELLDAVDRAVEAGLIGPVPGVLGWFRFSHEMVRETLYEELTSAGRMRLHLQTAAVLREIHAGDEAPHLAEIAQHLFEAAPLGNTAAAVDYARRAGEEAARSLAYEEASRLFRMALQSLELEEQADEGLLAELLLGEGDARARAGDLFGARESFLSAAENARRRGAATQLGRAALGYGGRLVWARAGDDHNLVTMVQDALVLLGGDDVRLRVRLLARLACLLRNSPDRERSDTLSRQALEIARGLDDPATLGYALVARCWAIYWPENPEERLELATELVRVAEDAGDAERAFDGHQVRSFFLADLGAIAEARAESNAGARMAEELRQPAQRWPVQATRTVLALLEGDFGRAEELMAYEMHPGRPTTPIRDDASAHQFHLFLLLREKGSSAELEEQARAAVDEFPWYPLHRAALACLLLELGQDAEARTVFDDLATDRFRALYRDCMWLLGMALTSEVCSRLGSRPEAAELYEQLLPFAGRHAVGHAEGSVGALDRYLGLLAHTLGHLDDAERHLLDAVKVNERMGARAWTAHSRFDLANVLLERDGPGDRERAIEELHAASDACGSLGMVVLGEQVAGRLRSLGSDSAPQPGPDAAIGPSVFRREGEYWSVVFGGDALRVRDSRACGTSPRCSPSRAASSTSSIWSAPGRGAQQDGRALRSQSEPMASGTPARFSTRRPRRPIGAV
jgi:tetratricopeptide (TPR) repeat protein